MEEEGRRGGGPAQVWGSDEHIEDEKHLLSLLKPKF